MADPNWNRGYYYGKVPPHLGMKLAREIATVTYRSGPEWEQRFGRQRADPSRPPALCPDFLIETYLDHAGEKFCLEYDPNSLLYVSKAMDLFDLGKIHQDTIAATRSKNQTRITQGYEGEDCVSCSLELPEEPYEEQPGALEEAEMKETSLKSPSGPPTDLVEGMRNITHPILVMGVTSDILFPSWQQKEIADAVKAGGNTQVEYKEFGEDVSLFGHDTFLLDLENIGGGVKKFLSGQ